AIALDAAEAGLGIALTRLSLALPRLQTGSLVPAHALVMPSPRTNLLVIRDDAATLPAVRCFADWVRREGRATADAIAGYATDLDRGKR
ncbi:hypothetical protein DBR42_18565, partial [Pelomonas sp. HMWF004]